MVLAQLFGVRAGETAYPWYDPPTPQGAWGLWYLCHLHRMTCLVKTRTADKLGGDAHVPAQGNVRQTALMAQRRWKQLQKLELP